MSSVVHFKFRSATGYDSISFEGPFITVGELKVHIAEKKSLTKDATLELVLSDPKTQTDYTDESAVIPKSSSVLVKRVPNLPNAPLLPQDKAKASRPQVITAANAEPVLAAEAVPDSAKDEFGEDLFTEQRDENEALAKMLQQTGQQWEAEIRQSNPRGRGRARGRYEFGGRGGLGRGRGQESVAPIVLPKGYICYRCGQQGHHITDCPTNTDPDFKRIRPAIGVPSVLLQQKEGGGLLLPDGTLGSIRANEDAFRKEMGLYVSSAQQKGESTAEPSDQNAIVLAGDPIPGELQLPLPTNGLLLPPGPLLPAVKGLPLPDEAPSSVGPMSREMFERLQEEMRKKAQRRKSSSRSRSRSRSRSPRRRRISRERRSRSPRRSDSPRRPYRSRRHYSRSPDRERRLPYEPRRYSPGFAPGFGRRRSRSPIRARRPYQPISRSPIGLHRPYGAFSPRRDRVPPRWQPDERDDASVLRKGSKVAGKAIAEPKDVFGAEFDDNEDAVVVDRNEEDEPQAPPKIDNEAKAGLSEPQLIGHQSGTLFSDNLDFKGEQRGRKMSGLGIAARLKPIGTLGNGRQKASKAKESDSLDVGPARESSIDNDQQPRSADRSKEEEEAPKKRKLPKTFTVPLDDGKAETPRASYEKPQNQMEADRALIASEPAVLPSKRRKTDEDIKVKSNPSRPLEKEEANTALRGRGASKARLESDAPVAAQDRREEDQELNAEDEHTIKVGKPKKEKHRHKEKKSKKSERDKSEKKSRKKSPVTRSLSPQKQSRQSADARSSSPKEKSLEARSSTPEKRISRFREISVARSPSPKRKSRASRSPSPKKRAKKAAHARQEIPEKRSRQSLEIRSPSPRRRSRQSRSASPRKQSRPRLDTKSTSPQPTKKAKLVTAELAINAEIRPDREQSTIENARRRAIERTVERQTSKDLSSEVVEERDARATSPKRADTDSEIDAKPKDKKKHKDKKKYKHASKSKKKHKSKRKESTPKGRKEDSASVTD